MSSTTASASILLPSFNLKTPSFRKPTLSLFTTLNAKPISISSFALPSRFARRVADMSAGFDVLSEEGDETSFSPDLKLFVGNLPFSVDSAQLADLFEGAGSVQMVEVIYDKMTGRSRGFGFVTMSTPDEVEAAARQFDGYEIEGRQIRVNNGPPPPKREFSSSREYSSPRGGGRMSARPNNANRLYVGNLSWDVDDSSLESLFREAGNVSEARVVCDRDTGRSRGFGFVSYSSADEANTAIESLNGVDLSGRQIRVSHAEEKPRRF